MQVRVVNLTKFQYAPVYLRLVSKALGYANLLFCFASSRQNGNHIKLWLRLTGELSFLIGEKIGRGLASLRSPIRF